VPDTEGPTCGSCFTLNPPGAPACIRCNTPLADAPAGPLYPNAAWPAAGTTPEPPAAAPPGGLPAGWAPARPAPEVTTPAAFRPPDPAPEADFDPSAPAPWADWQPTAPAAAERPAAAAPVTDAPAQSAAPRPADWSGTPGSTATGAAATPRRAAAPPSAVPGPTAVPGRTGMPPGPTAVPGLAQIPPGPQAPDAYQPPAAAARGLAVPPKGAPGASKQAAVAVQPPGFGPEQQAPPWYAQPRQEGFSPAEQRRIRRRITVVGLIFVLVVLAGGGAALYFFRPRYLDTDAVADRITAELTAKAGERVSVRCPGPIEKKAGASFTCTATDSHGIRQRIEGSVTDSRGSYKWSTMP
jgi:Domain of unknown function (DUF4333)